MSAAIRVYVVTYRRPQLLERALRSLVAQSISNWVAEVLNDDPGDGRAGEIVNRLGDPRISLATPAMRRGGTGNFNHAFRTIAEPYASILEDDNWWEPRFLETMLGTLERNPEVSVSCGNERIWREEPDGRWSDTGRTIWPPTPGATPFVYRAADKCGAARICNSSLLFRTKGAEAWQTPSQIPIDVTEHFRERVVPHPILLVAEPLVNYAETLKTHRSQSGSVWGAYQVLLIGSTFATAHPARRSRLAAELWQRAREREPLFATALLATSRAVPEARVLWNQATPREKFRFFLSALRHPRTTAAVVRAPQVMAESWNWLLRGPFAEFMAESHA